MSEEVQQLAALYQGLSNPQASVEDVKRIEQVLDQVYKNPGTLFTIFQLFFADTTKSIRLSCAIGMNHMLSVSGAWEFYTNNGKAEELKHIFLEALKQTNDVNLFENIVFATRHILKHDAMTWPQYFELLVQLQGGEGSALLALVMLRTVLAHLSEEGLHNIWENTCTFAMAALKTREPEVVIRASHVIAQLFTWWETKSDGLIELLSELMACLPQLLSAEHAGALSLIDDLGSIFETMMPLDHEQVLKTLVEMTMVQEFAIDHRVLLFEVIAKVFEKAADAPGCVSFLVDAAFAVAVQAFDPELCFKDQENMNIVMNIFEVFMEIAEHDEVYDLVKGRMGIAEPPIITAFVKAMDQVIRHCPPGYQKDVTTLLGYGITCTHTGHHTVQEAGFKLLSRMFSRSNDVFIEKIQEILSEIFNALKTDHLPLVESVLACLYKFLAVVPIDSETVTPVFEAIQQVLQASPRFLQSRVIDCLTSLARSAREDIRVVAGHLGPLVVPALDLTSVEDVRIRASAVDCWSVVLRFSEPESGVVTAFLQKCVEGLESGDDVLMASAMSGISELVIVRRPEIAPCIEGILSLLHKIMSKEPCFEDEEDQQEKNDLMEDVWCRTLNLVTALAKYLPDVIRPAIAALKADVYNLIEQSVNEVMKPAVRALTHLTIASPEDSENFAKALIENLDSFTTEFCAECFHCFGKFLEKIASPAPVVEAAAVCALQFMNRSLDCCSGADLSNYDVDLGAEAYYVLKTIASRYPEVFPLDDFMNQIQKTVKKGVAYEVSEAIGALTYYFSAAHEKMGSLHKKVIVRLIVEQLGICDFYVPPEPLAGIRAIAETEPALIQGYLPDIFKYIDEALGQEYQGELCFSITMDYIVSLLFSLFRAVLKDQFDVAKYVPKMLSLLPTTSSCPSEAANVYFSIVFLCGEYPQVMGQFGVEVVRILSQMLSVKEKDWADLALSHEIASACAVLLNNLVSSMAQGRDIVNAACPGLAAERLSARLASLA